MFWAQNREQTTKNCFLVTVNEEHFLKISCSAWCWKFPSYIHNQVFGFSASTLKLQ